VPGWGHSSMQDPPPPKKKNTLQARIRITSSTLQCFPSQVKEIRSTSRPLERLCFGVADYSFIPAFPMIAPPRPCENGTPHPFQNGGAISKGAAPYACTCFPVAKTWGATGRWWSPPLSAHLLCAAVADATLDPALFRKLNFYFYLVHFCMYSQPMIHTGHLINVQFLGRV